MACNLAKDLMLDQGRLLCSTCDGTSVIRVTPRLRLKGLGLRGGNVELNGGLYR